MSGFGKMTVKYESSGYDSFNPEEMSFEFRGSSDIGTFTIKGKDTSMWSSREDYEEEMLINLDRLKAMYTILQKFFDTY